MKKMIKSEVARKIVPVLPKVEGKVKVKGFAKTEIIGIKQGACVRYILKGTAKQIGRVCASL